MSSPSKTFHIGSVDDLDDWSRQFQAHIQSPCCIYLIGDLGAGKTTLAQMLIKHFGYTHAVTSPTYTLIQEYPVQGFMVYHMDLYRLDDPGELEFLAIADLWNDSSVFLIEWPERGGNLLPAADWTISLDLIDEQKRALNCQSSSKSKFMRNL